MNNPVAVKIHEVAPRDGLQNEAGWIDIDDKVRLVDSISGCGFGRIEVGSFVNPRLVPQMAGTAAVFERIRRRVGTMYSALVANSRGLESALAAGADGVAVFASASEGFSMANVGVSVAESLGRIRMLAGRAVEDGLPVRGYVSSVIACPYDGGTDPFSVLGVAESLVESGCSEISLGDTIGRGRPDDVRRLLEVVLERIPAERVAGHFHDTGGRALDNIAASLEFGVRIFDASLAGLGGCPFAPGSAGNVATENVCEMLSVGGYDTGIKQSEVERAASLARHLPGLSSHRRESGGGK